MSTATNADGPSRRADTGPTGDREFMATLAKGLSVLSSFGETRPAMTLSEAASATGLSRAAARRVLRTLASLGYVAQTGRSFTLTPRILELGFAYLSTQSWIDRAEPLMKELSHTLQESCSAAILQGAEIVYVARMPAPHRIMSATIAVGTRLPAIYTSLGRIQLGFRPPEELEAILDQSRLAPLTRRTIVDRAALKRRIAEDHAQGYSLVDEELEGGLRSIAVPIVSRSRAIVAAINLSAHASRASAAELRTRFLPPLKEVARQISRSLR